MNKNNLLLSLTIIFFYLIYGIISGDEVLVDVAAIGGTGCTNVELVRYAEQAKTTAINFIFKEIIIILSKISFFN